MMVLLDRNFVSGLHYTVKPAKRKKRQKNLLPETAVFQASAYIPLAVGLHQLVDDENCY